MPILPHRIVLLGAALWAVALSSVFPGDAAAPPREREDFRVPAADEIIRRVLTANAHTPDVASADVVFKFRLHRRRTEPPNCVFEGALRLERGRQVVAIDRQTFGLTCWVVNRFAIGRLVEGREPVQLFLARFDFAVLGAKLVDGRPWYLVQGKARDPRTRPRGMIGWVDYDRGLVTDGTLDYDWGTIDTEQRYAQVAEAWVLTYQYLTTQFLDASMEVLYTNFRFAAP